MSPFSATVSLLCDSVDRALVALLPGRKSWVWWKEMYPYRLYHVSLLLYETMLKFMENWKYNVIKHRRRHRVGLHNVKLWYAKHRPTLLL